MLLGISKRGDRYLQSVLVHGARSVVKLATNKDDSLSRWINKLKSTPRFYKTAVALTNKMARIGWALLRQETIYWTP